MSLSNPHMVGRVCRLVAKMSPEQAKELQAWCEERKVVCTPSVAVTDADGVTWLDADNFKLNALIEESYESYGNREDVRLLADWIKQPEGAEFARGVLQVVDPTYLHMVTYKGNTYLCSLDVEIEEWRHADTPEISGDFLTVLTSLGIEYDPDYPVDIVPIQKPKEIRFKLKGLDGK